MNPPFHSGDLPLSAQLDRMVARSHRHHRLLFVEHLPDDAFGVWARSRAIDSAGEIAYLDLAADGRGAVTGLVMGFEVTGDALDDALGTVLSGRQLVLVTGLDRALRQWGEPLNTWLAWCATHVALTVGSVRDAVPFVARLRHHAVAVDRRFAPAAAEPADPTVQISRKLP